MAHKLDMLNGAVNGMPPLHRDMRVDRWSRSFNRAYRHLCRQVDSGQATALDPYAAESPAGVPGRSQRAVLHHAGDTGDDLSCGLPATGRLYRQDPPARFMACGRLPAAPVPAGPEPEYDWKAAAGTRSNRQGLLSTCACA